LLWPRSPRSCWKRNEPQRLLEISTRKMTTWKLSPNRGFYYGSSKDTKWNHEEAWRAYVNKTDLIDTMMNHEKALAERGKTRDSRGGTSSTRQGTGAMRSTGSTAAGRKSVEGLVRALNAEQEMRVRKERALEQLLLDEAAARVNAEQEIKELRRKYDHLVDRLAAPGMPLHGNSRRRVLQATSTTK